jgi:UDP-N-acetylglucosamine diphosphorylase / glucose-1-phosphate thymidylyltransferase / UDP-N-acetylgalactosamine diphosphorylase / glucosamine-1-phosphate N-acetyltransferase / galactosamine-1-phosphate N-acetyltransferase
MRLIVFEDHKALGFYPLSETRPVWELRCGMGTLKERLSWRFGQPVEGGFCREELIEVAEELGTSLPAEDGDDDLLVVNARLLQFDPQSLLALKPKDALLLGQDLVAARLNSSDFEATFILGEGELNVVEAPEDFLLVEHLWQLIHLHASAAESDWPFVQAELSKTQREALCGDCHETVILRGDRIRIDAGAKIDAHCLLDASQGPIWIAEDAEIAAFSVIEGPIFVGSKSRIKPMTRLLGGCHIGPQSRLAGEVAESITQGFSNKQHDGFLGHAYLGAWTNLGADTNNSDLKNNYGSVKVSLRGESMDTRERLVGLMMGDHAKCGINTMFNTGTVVGAFANLWGGGFPPNEVLPFSWGGPQDTFVPYDLEKALATASIVKGRRGEDLSEAEVELFSTLHRSYQDEFTFEA